MKKVEIVFFAKKNMSEYRVYYNPEDDVVELIVNTATDEEELPPEWFGIEDMFNSFDEVMSATHANVE